MSSPDVTHSAAGYTAVVFGCFYVFAAVYASTLNLVAATIAAVVLFVGAGAAIFFGHRRRNRIAMTTSSAEALAQRRRAGWISCVFAVFCALMALGAAANAADSGLSTEARCGLVAGALALALVALDSATGRLAADFRRLRQVARTDRRHGSTMYAVITMGVVFGFIGFGGYVSDNGLRTNGATARALVRHVTSFRANTYFLEFTTASGKTINCSTELVKGNPRPGDFITVRYERSDPGNNCQDARESISYVAPTVWSAIGAALLGLARWLYLRSRRLLTQH